MDTGMLEIFLNPWYDALDDPAEAQHRLAETLIHRYRNTAYGQKYNARDISTLDEFRAHFPVATFPAYEPSIEQVKQGKWEAFLTEPPVEWGMTRGTTGKSKIIPYTPTEVEERFMVGPRCLMNYVYKTGDTSLFDGYILMFVYPSFAGRETYGDRQHTYGYTSGIYTHLFSQRMGVKLVYTLEEINPFGTERTEPQSKKRLEYIYSRCHDLPVTAIIGIAQLLLLFGSVTKKNHHVYPRDLWKGPLLISSSLPNVHARYNPALRAMYNYKDLRDIYGATEGFYAQQLDERPYCFPNYDYYLFEVQRGKKIKMLHEMKKGERGSLIVSSTLFPRYKIGDIVKNFGDGGIACISREDDFYTVKYWYDRFMGYAL